MSKRNKRAKSLTVFDTDSIAEYFEGGRKVNDLTQKVVDVEIALESLLEALQEQQKALVKRHEDCDLPEELRLDAFCLRIFDSRYILVRSGNFTQITRKGRTVDLQASKETLAAYKAATELDS